MVTEGIQGQDKQHKLGDEEADGRIHTDQCSASCQMGFSCNPRFLTLGSLSYSASLTPRHNFLGLTFQKPSIIFTSIKYIHIAVQPSPPTISRTFSSSETETLYSLNNNSPFSPPPAPFYSMNLTALGTSYQWTLTIFVLLYLAYFTYHNVFKVVACFRISFLLQLNNIPLCYIPHFIHTFIY